MNPPPTLSYESSNRSSEQRKLFAFYFVFHLVLSCILVGYVLFIVPYFQEIFSAFRTRLPAITEWVINAADLATHGYGWIVSLAMVAAWSMLIAFLFVESEGSPWKRRFVVYSLFLVYLAALLTVLTAVVLPYLRLFASINGAP